MMLVLMQLLLSVLVVELLRSRPILSSPTVIHLNVMGWMHTLVMIS